MIDSTCPFGTPFILIVMVIGMAGLFLQAMPVGYVFVFNYHFSVGAYGHTPPRGDI
jgi:hypothetical protein